MGCALPGAIKHMVRLVKSLTKLPVEVHTHNDFGMAVATELAGVEAGAECVHSCANGLGERTGNAALEELIVALHVLYGYRTHYDLSKLPELGELVSRLSRFDIAANKPILGERNFTYHLEQLGITGIDDQMVAEMLRCVKEKGINKRGLLTPEEFKEIVDRVLGAVRGSAARQ